MRVGAFSMATSKSDGSALGRPEGCRAVGLALRVFSALASRCPRHGVAPTFEKARNALETAWADILLRCSNTDFDEYRYERAHLAWKYKMWDTGCRMPTQAAAERSRCFCGVEITTAIISDHPSATHGRGMTCCEDEGWVCETHPDQAFWWSTRLPMWRRRMPCPNCNRSSQDEPPRLPRGFEPDA